MYATMTGMVGIKKDIDDVCPLNLYHFIFIDPTLA